MIDALPLGEIDWQHAPLDSPFGHIKDGIEHGSHTQGARSSTAFGGGDHLFDPLPFLVSQVAWIYFFVHLPILHNLRRLFRQALRRWSQRPYIDRMGLDFRQCSFRHVTRVSPSRGFSVFSPLSALPAGSCPLALSGSGKPLTQGYPLNPSHLRWGCFMNYCGAP